MRYVLFALAAFGVALSTDRAIADDKVVERVFTGNELANLRKMVQPAQLQDEKVRDLLSGEEKTQSILLRVRYRQDKPLEIGIFYTLKGSPKAQFLKSISAEMNGPDFKLLCKGL